MNVRSIPFSASMVAAVIGGRKSQTRRIVKPQPKLSPHHEPVRAESRGGLNWVFMVHTDRPGYAFATGDVRCPYGAAGDLLYVREAWRAPKSLDDLSPAQIGEKAVDAGYSRPWCPIQYEADGSRVNRWHDFGSVPGAEKPGRYRHARFMPRWASRLTLKITDVRVERLHLISDADARAEGARHFPDLPLGRPMTQPARWSMEDAPPSTDHCLVSPKWAFANYWNKINGDGSWDQNPFVWVVAFEPILRNVDDVLRDARVAA